MPINIVDLKTRILALQVRYNSLDTSESGLKDTVLSSYGKQCMGKLADIVNQPHTENSLLETQFGAFLRDNWNLVKSTSLSYTSLPEHEITSLLCDIAEFIAEVKTRHDGDQPVDIVKLLMPTVQTSSFSDNVQSLGPYQNAITGQWVVVPEVSLRNILHTHIVANDGLSLLPVGLLADLEPGTESQRLANPYYDYSDPTMSPYLNDDEYERLVEHSSLTRDVYEAKKLYETHCADNSNLLGHLWQLCSQLAYNSAGYAGGVGQEENAAGGTYPAIIAFNDYYLSLSQEDKNNIPVGVKQEIELLLNLSANPGANINATETIATCIATRRKDLEKAMLGQEKALSLIALQGTHKENLIEQSKTQFHSAKSALVNGLNNNQYPNTGSDKLGLTLPLLNALQITLSISSPQDLKTIQSLNPTEIREFFKNPQLQYQFGRQFNTVEDLVIFSIETSPKKLQALLSMTAYDFVGRLILRSTDLSTLLISLDAERGRIVCEAFKTHFMKILNPYGGRYDTDMEVFGFGRMLQYLNPVQCSIVCDVYKNELPIFIQTAAHFKELLTPLNPEQRTAVYQAFKDNIHHLAHSTNKLRDIFELLNDEQRTELYEAHKDDYLTLVTTPRDFENLLTFLNSEQRTDAFNTLKNKFSVISSLDFANVMKYLNPDQRLEIYNVFEQQLLQWVTSGWAFACTVIYLDADQSNVIFNACKSNIPQWLHSASDFKSAMGCLNPVQRAFIFEACKPYFAQWTGSTRNINDVMKFLDSDQRAIIFETCMPGPKLIKSIESFNEVMQYLEPYQRAIIYDQNKSQLSKFILGYFPFLVKALQYLNKEQGEPFINEFKTRLPENWTADGFGKSIQELGNDHYDHFCSIVTEKLPELLKTPMDLVIVLRYLDIEQSLSLCHTLRDDFSRIITSLDDFYNLFRYLDFNQSIAIYNLLKDRINPMIQSPTDLVTIFKSIPTWHCGVCCEAMKGRIMELIPTTNSLIEFLRELPVEKRTLIYHAIRGQASTVEINDDFLDKLAHAQVNITGATHAFKDAMTTMKSADKQANLKAPKMQFELSLASANHVELKTEFDGFISQTNAHRSRFFTSLNTTSCDQLIESLSRLQNRDILGKLNDALELGLTSDALDSPQMIKEALELYIVLCVVHHLKARKYLEVC